MLADCIFCKIGARELNADVVYEDSDFMAFKDINPMAPTHVLIIPKKHISSLLDEASLDPSLLGKLLALVPQLARKLGLAEKGFRVVINTGEFGGQTVNHLHFHLLGGRELQWPPG